MKLVELSHVQVDQWVTQKEWFNLYSTYQTLNYHVRFELVLLVKFGILPPLQSAEDLNSELGHF